MRLPKSFRTTGIKFVTAAFVVFAVSPSTDALNVPSKEITDVNIVKIIPKHQTIELLKNFAIPAICTLSEILDAMLSTQDINSSGIRKLFEKLPIKFIMNNKIG